MSIDTQRLKEADGMLTGYMNDFRQPHSQASFTISSVSDLMLHEIPEADIALVTEVH